MKNNGVLPGIIIIIVIGIIAVGVMFYMKNQDNSFVTVGNNVSTQNKIVENKTTGNNTAENKVLNTTKSEQTGTAGSNIPLKDNQEEAKRQIEIAMKNYIKEAYGNEVVDCKINVTKVYTEQEEQQNEALKQQNLGPNEVAFEVSYELKIADGVTDEIKFTAATGSYNKETRWVTDKFNLGILRPDGNGYKITDFGTGW